MSEARYLVGDVFDRLAEIPDGSVDLVLTSPPFLALRSYLPADHPDKAREIGSEPTPAEFLATLLGLTAEWRRVLAPHGSIVVELGDTYSGSGGAGGDYNEGGMRDMQPRFAGSGSKHRMESAKAGSKSRLASGKGWPLPKSLCGIPHLYHLSLAYGRNMLTGEPCDPWRVRNVVAWCRPNPPVGALGDKFRPATSYLTIACVSGKRYFDLDAVRTDSPRTDNSRTTSTQYEAPGQPARKTRASDETGARIHANPAGAPPLDWWEIPTSPYPGSHYATYPEALCVRPIEAMCPRKVCRTCGEPSRRIVGEAEYVNSKTGKPATTLHFDGERHTTGENHWDTTGKGDRAATRAAPTLGWTDCGHDAWRNGLVLDPFAGSGTTLAVATARGRDAIGIDLDARNLDLARARIGMWLVEEPPAEAAS